MGHTTTPCSPTTSPTPVHAAPCTATRKRARKRARKRERKTHCSVPRRIAPQRCRVEAGVGDTAQTEGGRIASQASMRMGCFDDVHSGETRRAGGELDPGEALPALEPRTQLMLRRRKGPDVIVPDR